MSKDLLKRAEEIRDETGRKKNTATRVGSVMVDIASEITNKANSNMTNVPNGAISPEQTQFGGLIDNLNEKVKFLDSTYEDNYDSIKEPGIYVIEHSIYGYVHLFVTKDEGYGTFQVLIHGQGWFITLRDYDKYSDRWTEHQPYYYSNSNQPSFFDLKIDTGKISAGKSNKISTGLTRYNIVGSGNTVTAENAIVQGNNNNVNHENCIVIGNNILTILPNGKYYKNGNLHYADFLVDPGDLPQVSINGTLALELPIIHESRSICVDYNFILENNMTPYVGEIKHPYAETIHQGVGRCVIDYDDSTETYRLVLLNTSENYIIYSGYGYIHIRYIYS